MSHDEETARLLAELEGEKTEREQLEARADELGVSYRGNTGDDTIRQRIAEAEAALAPVEEPEFVTKGLGEYLDPAAAKPDHKAPVADVLTNPGRSVRRMGIVTMAPASKHTLTEREKSDERTMAKVNHMVKLGVINRGAD